MRAEQEGTAGLAFRQFQERDANFSAVGSLSAASRRTPPASEAASQSEPTGMRLTSDAPPAHLEGFPEFDRGPQHSC